MFNVVLTSDADTSFLGAGVMFFLSARGSKHCCEHERCVQVLYKNSFACVAIIMLRLNPMDVAQGEDEEASHHITEELGVLTGISLPQHSWCITCTGIALGELSPSAG